MKKYPKRITSIGEPTGEFYTRACPQYENKEVIGELFKTNKNNFFAAPYCLVYKQSLPFMKDGYMTWYFESIAQIKKASWKKLKKDK